LFDDWLDTFAALMNYVYHNILMMIVQYVQ